MTEQLHRQPGEFCWVELLTHDGTKAQAFYENLLGWKTQKNEFPGGEYLMFRVGKTDIAGGFEMDETMRQQNIPQHWNPYVFVTDVDATAKKAKELGATILKEPFDVFDMGRMAVFTDPSGATLSLWQSKKKSGSVLPRNTPGNIGWNELMTKDTSKAETFYTQLFGWKTNKREMENGVLYTTFMIDDYPVAGMFELSGEFKNVPPHWETYFTVTDLANTLEQVKNAGGQICYNPITLPEVGQFTMIRDPQGSHCSLVEFEK